MERRDVGATLGSHRVRVDGLRVHALAGGLEHDATPIVLVHGLGVSSRYFEPLARELCATMPVLAPDLPGFGRSDRPRRALSVRALARALTRWLDAAGINRAAVLGQSLGCQVAVETAVREPERVDALVLVGPTVDPRARGWLPQARRLLADTAREPVGLLAIVARDYARVGPQRFAATARAALVDAIETKLPHVVAPTLLIRGEHDALVPQRWAEEAAALLQDGRLAVVTGEPHACHFTAPHAVAELVRARL